MITNFDDFSGVISVVIDDRTLYFHVEYDENKEPFEVNLTLKSGEYIELSVNIPDSDELNHKEFFLNPKVVPKIVAALEKENFIQETGKESVAGEKKTKSYVVI